MNKKKISSSIFLLVIICFFLQFVTVSCEGQDIAKFSGMQLVTGTEVLNPMTGKPQKTDSDPTAIIMLVLALAGVGLGFYKHRNGVIISAIAGGLGAIMDFVTKSTITSQAAKSKLDVSFGMGFYSILILFLAAAGLNAYVLYKKEDFNIAASQIANTSYTPPGTNQTYIPPDSPPGVPYIGTKKFCSECGAENISENTFCKSCGHKFEV